MHFINKTIIVLLFITLAACSHNSSLEKSKETQGLVTEKDNTAVSLELALYKKAVLTLNNKQLNQAETLFLEMSKVQPDMAGSWANLALIRLKKDDLNGAKEYIEIALDKNPNMPQVLNLAGDVALKEDRLNDAKTYFELAIKNKNDYALAHYNLALIYDIYLQDIPLAVQHYELYLQYSTQPDKSTEKWVKGLKSIIQDNNS